MDCLEAVSIYATGAIIDLGELVPQPALTNVSIHSAAKYTRLSVLRRIPRLRDLTLNLDRPGVWRSIAFLAQNPHLESLWLDSLQKVHDYEPLRSLTNLTDVWLDEATLLTNLDPIRHLKLDSLSLSDCTIDDVAAQVADIFPDLDTLYLNGTRTQDVEPLARLPLQVLDLDGCPVTDLRPLAGKTMELSLTDGKEYRGLDELGPGVVIRYC